MDTETKKKKPLIVRLLLWGLVIFAVLHILTLGQTTDLLLSALRGESPDQTEPTKKPVSALTPTPGTTAPVPTEEVDTTVTTAAPTEPEPERLPSVPEALQDHVYLRSRRFGSCDGFTGDVVLLAVFVNDPQCSWSDAEISQMKAGIEATADRIRSDATSYGAQLDLTVDYTFATSSVTLDKDIYIDWVNSAFSSMGLPSAKDGACTQLEDNYGADEVPVIFLTNQQGRSFAHSTSYTRSGSEYALIYQETEAIYHEVCHLFGAKDFYYPLEISDLVDTYLTNSIMADSEDGVMESLTAYTIGWTDSLSDSALRFLEKTAYLTQGYLDEQREQNTYTGYVENFQTSGATYTGYLVDGIRHGQGKLIWDNGSSYEGNWVHGSQEGTGKMVYASGDVYDGQWYDGQRHGSGTYSWANGSRYTGQFRHNARTGQGTWSDAAGNTYTGDFVDGQLHGTGTYKWANGGSYTGGWADSKRSGYGVFYYADGARYEGQWVNGERNGQGKLFYANGNTYEGNWVDGTWQGQGTFRWTSGDMYTGNFVDGKRHGYGIYYYPNGNRYEGEWANGERHGQGTLYYANGTSKSGKWENGSYVG